MAAQLNPYAAPREDERDPACSAAEWPESGDAASQRIRRENLQHELTAIGIGSLFCLSAAFFLFVAGVYGFAVLTQAIPLSPWRSWTELRIFTEVLLFALGVGTSHLIVGLALWSLDGRVRAFAMLFAVLGLLLFPIGTLLSAYVLSWLQSPHAEFVLSRRYRDVVAATGAIECPTPVRIWFMLAALALTPVAFLMFCLFFLS